MADENATKEFIGSRTESDDRLFGLYSGGHGALISPVCAC